ncbi:hypothetical protein HDU67_006150 [Dinochytrium kinnereticum]|nr:hypothetical protein HDU67_006150 [Dinochytrium kinnereticum]
MLAQKTTVRDLKIKTGVAKRLGKELQSYRAEAVKQQQRIDTLIAGGGDEYDVRKQREVLDETHQMLPDTQRRLTSAVQELDGIVTEFLKHNPDSGESEEIVEARDVLQTISTLV